MLKKLNIFSLKLHKNAEILKKPQTFLNKNTKHKNNYMEDLNSKNKNIFLNYVRNAKHRGKLELKMYLNMKIHDVLKFLYIN